MGSLKKTGHSISPPQPLYPNVYFTTMIGRYSVELDFRPSREDVLIVKSARFEVCVVIETFVIRISGLNKVNIVVWLIHLSTSHCCFSYHRPGFCVHCMWICIPHTLLLFYLLRQRTNVISTRRRRLLTVLMFLILHYPETSQRPQYTCARFLLVKACLLAIFNRSGTYSNRQILMNSFFSPKYIFELIGRESFLLVLAQFGWSLLNPGKLNPISTLRFLPCCGIGCLFSRFLGSVDKLLVVIF